MSGVLSVLGFVLIILSWSLQLYYSAARKVYVLSLRFVAIYVIGCILLVIEAALTGETVVLIFYLMITILAFAAGYFAKKARSYARSG